MALVGDVTRLVAIRIVALIIVDVMVLTLAIAPTILDVVVIVAVAIVHPEKFSLLLLRTIRFISTKHHPTMDRSPIFVEDLGSFFVNSFACEKYVRPHIPGQAMTA